MFRRQEQTAPPQILKRMPSGGIDLRWQSVAISGKTYWLFLYVIPKGRNENAGALTPAERAKPITRKEIFDGLTLKYSPFTMELYAAPNAITPLHTTTYFDEYNIWDISVKYLRPQEKKGPILLMSGGITHWRSWTLVVLPEGVEGKRVVLQRFLWGGEGGTGVEQKFDRTDPRGFLQVNQEFYEEGKPNVRTVFRWDGFYFVDPEARWFVLGAVSRNRKDVVDFIRKHTATDFAEIIETSRFPRLAPNLYAALLARCRTEKEALEESKRFKNIGVTSYIKRGF